MNATRTMEQVRAWQGPGLLTYGFRPFFFGAAVWAAVAMTLWIGMLSGRIALPSAFDPVSWHAHEFLFGYLGAVVAGFLLTAVPNWTGRLPIVGWPLGGLVGLWVAGRVAIATSDGWPALSVAAMDLSFLIVLALVIAREIVAGRNWRNLMVLVLLALLIAGNALFHFEAAAGHIPAHGYGLRLGLAAAIMMIGLIGGKIVPSFTRNWLIKREEGRLPSSPMRRFDRGALVGLLLALGTWVVWPETYATGALLVVAGILHLVRLARWAGERTGAEPLVLVLHAGYAFVPIGALALGFATLWSQPMLATAAQHVWMAGAIGLMTLAVMTRATLGHTNQPLHAGAGTVAIYLALVLSVVARVFAPAFPAWLAPFHLASAVCWIGAFAGFAILYGRHLIRARVA